MVILQWLVLPVHDLSLMEEGNPAKQHQHVAFDFFSAQRVLRIPYNFRQVRDHKLENKDKSHSLRENVIQPMKGRIKDSRIFSLDHKLAFELLQRFDLANSSFADSILKSLERHFLQCHHLIQTMSHELEPFLKAITWPDVLCRHFMTIP